MSRLGGHQQRGCQQQSRRRKKRTNTASHYREGTRNWFDMKVLEKEEQRVDLVDMDDPVALAGRYLADSKWQERADERMARCEQLLTHISARSGKPGSDKLLSFHSEIFMLGGGDARIYNRSASRQQRLKKGSRNLKKRYSPIRYCSPLAAPKKGRTATKGLRKLTANASLRPRSANLSGRRKEDSSRSSQGKRRRPQSAHLEYVMRGKTRGEEQVRPYKYSTPLKLDLPWMRLKDEPSRWRSSWQPDQPLTFTSKQQLQPIDRNKSRKHSKRKRHRRREKRLADQHWVVDLAAQRREMLKPMLQHRDCAARVIQRFLLSAFRAGIREKWVSFVTTQNQRRTSAITQIQRLGRGYIVRSSLQLARKESLEKTEARLHTAREEAAVVIQNNWRIVLSRRRVAIFRKVVALRRKHSIRRIQRSIRRRNVRLGVRRMVEQAGAFGKEAIVKMQGLFRGKLARKKTQDLKTRRSWLQNMEDAGTYGKKQLLKMQSLFRGRLAKKKVAALKDTETKEDTTWVVKAKKSAVVLQSHFRGFIGRRFSRAKRKNTK